jgi:polyisoprenyl-teichoic acid--peptidoglycan teichoic acid transferase
MLVRLNRLLSLTYRFSLLIVISLTICLHTDAQDATLEADPIPDAMPMVDEGNHDIINILLIGVANENINRPGLADSIMVVSINRDLGMVSVLSLPRDLWVYIAGHGIDKLNTAHFYGERDTDPDITGASLLTETIRYNLGVEIDYYARINFRGLKDIVDTLGGLTITVDCALQDWKIIDPEGDKHDEDNWELFTLWGGVHQLDGETALWYARSRRTSSDLDRSRRQQDILRAMWRTFQRRGLLNDLPTLYQHFINIVDTDITLDVLFSFTPLALTVDTGDVDYHHMRIHHEIENAFSSGEGKAILQMNRDAVATLMQNLILPSTANQLTTEHPTIALVNASGIEGWVYVAAHRLELEGFKAFVLNETTRYREWNHIIDYTGADKGNPIETIQRVLRVTDDGVSTEPDANRQYDYKVAIGGNYGATMCTRSIMPPKPLDEDGNVITAESDG